MIAKPIWAAAVLAFGLNLGGCATSTSGSNKAPLNLGPEDYSGCGIKIVFASYAMGIDRGTYDQMRAHISRNYPYAQIVEHPWGREGERNLCVVISPKTAARKLSNELQAMIPKNPRGPVNVIWNDEI